VDGAASEPRLASDVHDPVLALALGSLSLLNHGVERLDRQSSGGESQLAPEDPVVLAALGVVALRRCLQRWVEEIADPRRDSAATASVVPESVYPDLLR